MIGQETEGEDGAFTIIGQARVALAGAFNAWVVETGDHRALPGFWGLLHGAPEAQPEQPPAAQA